MLVACGEDSTPSGSDVVTTLGVELSEPEVTGAPAATAQDSAPATTEPSPQPTSTTEAPAPTTEAPTTAMEPATAPCTTDAIMPVVAGLFPENESWNIIDVDIRECQNGYARVIAIADQSTCDLDFPNCLEDEQVFLRDLDGSWEYFTSGTGIECNNAADLWPEMITVCEALGIA
jgi:hypothetical protein